MSASGSSADLPLSSKSSCPIMSARFELGVDTDGRRSGVWSIGVDMAVGVCRREREQQRDGAAIGTADHVPPKLANLLWVVSCLVFLQSCCSVSGLDKFAQFA